MGLFEKINTIWQKVSVVQRALLVATVMACVITGTLLTKWASRPEMRLLFGNLAIEEASKVADKISEKGIKYQFQAGGTSIYVPAENVFELRASLAKDGLPQAGELGYKVFDNEKIGVSPLVQKMNYNRALQGELARTIQMLDGISLARVHIVRPDQTMFTSAQEAASASVMVQLKPGWKLNPSTVAAITNLVAGATEGLTPDKVIVTDSNGNLLTNNTGDNGVLTGANTYMDYKDRVEKTIAGNIEDLLSGPLGYGRAKVRVNAVIDMTSTQTQSTTYEKGQPLEETINSTSTIKQSPADTENKSASPASTDKQETIENKYKVPETIVTKSDLPGKIVSLSVSVVVDLSKPPAAETPKTDAADKASPASPAEMIMTVEDVTEVIRNAVGTDLLKDNKALTVKNVSFPRAVLAPDESAKHEKMGWYMEIARQSSIGIMAVCALIALKIFTSATKRAAQNSLPTASGQMGQLDTLNTAIIPAGGPNELAAAIRQQLTHELRNNPEQVRQLFTSWLAEEV